MIDPAQASSTSSTSTISAVTQDQTKPVRFGSRLRSAFATTGQITPQTVTRVQSSTQPESTQENASETELSLSVLEKIMDEVEQQRATTTVTAAVNQEPALSSNPNLNSSLDLNPIQAPAPQPSALPQEQASVDQMAANPGVLAQAMPAAVTQAAVQDQLQYQPQVGSSIKEQASGLTVEHHTEQVPTGVQVVEHEPSPEISPEVESFIAKTTDHADQLPAEISIAGDQITLTPSTLPKKPVIVLPITPEIEKEGARKNSKWSVRWLVEWSRKLMKMFSGEIIYRQN